MKPDRTPGGHGNHLNLLRRTANASNKLADREAYFAYKKEHGRDIGFVKRTRQAIKR